MVYQPDGRPAAGLAAVRRNGGELALTHLEC